MTISNIWQGKLVRLRAVEPEDWQYFFDLERDTDAGRETDMILFPASREVIKKWTSEVALKEPWKDHEYRWMIENRQDECVGTINTFNCNPRMGTFRYGIFIGREHRRKGYATEAIGLVLRHFFHELRYQKVNVDVYAFNTASLLLHQQIGFQEEGRLRRMVYSGGCFHDTVVLGMTAEEFAATEWEDEIDSRGGG